VREPAVDGLPLGRRSLVVATVSITTILSVLDGMIANVALPTIADDLHVSSAAVVWVVNAFQLATAMLLVPMASLGDIVGFARIYRIGVAVFVVASLGCALSPSLPWLVAARTLQGMAAAAVLSSSQPITRFSYPAAMIGVSVGIQSLVVSISSAAGPSIGGFILHWGSWPWLFWINVPFGLLCLAASGILPATPRSAHRFDWPSAVLSGATLIFFITGLDQLRAPIHWLWFAAEMVLAAITGTLVVRRQRRLDPPFLAVDLLKIRIVRLSLITSFIAFTAQNAALIALPFYFRDFGYGADRIGLLMTPFPLGSALIATVAGWLADRYHAAWLGIIGLGTFALGMVLLTVLPAHPSMLDIAWRTMVAGVGFGLFVSPNLRAIIASAPRNRMGAISGITTSSRMTGSTTGVALAALFFGSAAASVTSGGVPAGTIHIVLWVAAGLALVALVSSALRLEVARPDPAEHRRSGGAIS
jgi:DHA2 family multidrug resistance protein-like MFS transporter